MKAGHFSQADDIFVGFRRDIDVGASAQDEFGGAHRPRRRWIDRLRPGHAVKGRLHRSGRNLEWLEKVSADAEGDDERDEDNFCVFSQSGQRRRRSSLVEETMKLLRGGNDVLARVFPQGDLQTGNGLAQGNDLFLGQNILPVAQQLPGCPEDKLGFFSVARGQEKHVSGNKQCLRRRRKGNAAVRSDDLFAVIQPGCIDLLGSRRDARHGMVYRIERGGDRRKSRARKVGQGNPGALQGEAGLLEGFVGRAESFGPRVERVHCALVFSSCSQRHLGEHFSLQPQSLHWA